MTWTERLLACAIAVLLGLLGVGVWAAHFAG